jgi:hypothetical protein
MAIILILSFLGIMIVYLTADSGPRSAADVRSGSARLFDKFSKGSQLPLCGAEHGTRAE